MSLDVGNSIVITFSHEHAKRITKRSFLVKEVKVDWSPLVEEPELEDIQKWVDGKFHRTDVEKHKLP